LTTVIDVLFIMQEMEVDRMARHTTLTAEQRIARINERHKEWQRKNPDKVREYRERYIVRKAAKLQSEAAKQHDSKKEG